MNQPAPSANVWGLPPPDANVENSQLDGNLCYFLMAIGMLNTARLLGKVFWAPLDGR